VFPVIVLLLLTGNVSINPEKVIQDYFETIGGIERWSKVKYVRIESRNWGNFDVNNTRADDLLLEVTPTKQVNICFMDIDSTVSQIYDEKGKLSMTRTNVRGENILELRNGYTHTSRPGPPYRPLPIQVLELYQKGEFKFHDTKQFQDNQYYVLKYYDKNLRKWHFCYFNATSKLLEYRLPERVIGPGTKFSEYTEQNGIMYPKVSETYKYSESHPDGLRFFKSEITDISFEKSTSTD
jgi:hypothetical protein